MHNRIVFSHKKRNPFDSVLIRRMTLEPIIQSEVSQKEKGRYRMLLLLLLLSHFSRVQLCVTHRWQPTRLHCPWDSPGKDTGVGCHFLLQCMKVKSEREVAQSCLTLHDPMDCSLPGSSIHGIFQARVLEWVAIVFSEISYTNAYILNLERWYQRIYLQNSSEETDTEHRRMDTGRG